MSGNAREATIDLIQRYYAAFDAGDMPRFLGMLTEDVVHHVNQGATELGKPAFTRFMDKMNAHYKERVESLVVMASDDGARAAAEFVIVGNYLKTDAGLPPARGQEYRLPVAAMFDVRAGKVARVSNFYNLESWMEMVR